MPYPSPPQGEGTEPFPNPPQGEGTEPFPNPPQGEGTEPFPNPPQGGREQSPSLTLPKGRGSQYPTEHKLR